MARIPTERLRAQYEAIRHTELDCVIELVKVELARRAKSAFNAGKAPVYTDARHVSQRRASAAYRARKRRKSDAVNGYD
jgi:hypothetical protein